MELKIYYRISDKGNIKNKPSYITWENCLRNFITHFHKKDIHIIADNVEEVTYAKLLKYVSTEQITRTNLGNGNGLAFTFLKAIKENPDNTFIYFVEDDYLHIHNSKQVLLEGLQRADYVSLYDHPDKYMNPSPNPFVKNGGEYTRVITTNSTHWKNTNSTCMTFATSVKILKQDIDIFLKYTRNLKIPSSFDVFTYILPSRNRQLITPIPSYATHGETKYLALFRDWGGVI